MRNPLLSFFTLVVLVSSPLQGASSGKDNPFSPFFGVWTLKGDTFNQVWDGKTLETVNIPNHITICKPINTAQSMLCEVNASSFAGHILWTMNTESQIVSHLSHFGDARHGVGSGTLDANDNFISKVSFQGEPEGSHRQYQYKWHSKDEYEMKSVQYSESGEPTGNWYGGTFIRLDENTFIKQQINETNSQIRQAFIDADIDQILSLHHKHVEKVFAWDNHQRGHDDMRKALEGLFVDYQLSFEGQVEDMRSMHIDSNYVSMIADFTLVGTPRNKSNQAFTYSGVTMITYTRDSNSPTGWSTLREMVIAK